MEKIDEHVIECQSDQAIDSIMTAVERTKSLASTFGFNLNEALQLQLVAEEACSNAYEYCLEQKNEKVKVEWLKDDASFALSICHQGTPYKIKKSDEINFGRRGRGIQLILHIMDDVDLTSKDQHVRLTMKKYFKATHKG